jgi:hypothetical protein
MTPTDVNQPTLEQGTAGSPAVPGSATLTTTEDAECNLLAALDALRAGNAVSAAALAAAAVTRLIRIIPRPPAAVCAGCGNDYNPEWNRSRTGKSAKQCATCAMNSLEKFLSEPPDGYCWCNMCGYNAHLEGKDRAKVESDEPCPVCKEAGDASLLCVGDELDESVTADDPMLIWPETDPHTQSAKLTDAP